MIALFRKTTLKNILVWAGAFSAFLLIMTKTIHHLYPTYRIQGVSMLPTVSPNSKQKAILFFDAPARHDIFILDADQFATRPNRHEHETFIKRLVGLPGDTLTFRAQDKVLLKINDTPVEHIAAPEFQSFSLTSKKTEFHQASFENHAYWLKDGAVKYPVYLPDSKNFEHPTPELRGYLDEFFKSSYLDAQPAQNGMITIKVPEGHYFALSDNRIALSDSREYGPVPASSLQYKVIQ